jgi:hypothetical protein
VFASIKTKANQKRSPPTLTSSFSNSKNQKENDHQLHYYSTSYHIFADNNKEKSKSETPTFFYQYQQTHKQWLMTCNFEKECQ